MKLARNLLATGEGRSALIAIAQNAAGQAFDQETVRRKAQASVPGDGAAVGLVTRPPSRRSSTSNAAPTASTPAT